MFNGIKNSTQLLDMDISDPEQSDMDQTDDDYILEEDEWFPTRGRRRHQTKKNNSKTSNNSGSSSNVENGNDSEGFIMASGEGNSASDNNKSEPATCCTCSKKSLCKTMKCECRAAEGHCGVACGCDLVRCSNRGALPSELSEGADETERSHSLASQGAMLLQSALSEKPANTTEGETGRKPLSDIGNTVVWMLLSSVFFSNFMELSLKVFFYLQVSEFITETNFKFSGQIKSTEACTEEEMAKIHHSTCSCSPTYLRT